MVAWTSDRRSRLIGLAIGAVLAVGVTACAAHHKRTARPAEARTGESNVLVDVRVERDEDATVLTFLGVEDPIYTAFMHQDPAALVVDLENVEPGPPSDPIVVYDGLIEQVDVSGFSSGDGDPMMRIEVGLVSASDYEIMSGPNGLVVEIRPKGAGSETADGSELDGAIAIEEPDESAFDDDPAFDDEFAADEDPWAVEEVGLVEDEAAEETAEATAPQVTAAPATKLLGVEANDTGAGTLLVLRADGVLDGFESFTLEDPDRLVVDMPGIENGTVASRTDVGSAEVARVRVGAHTDKVRVVVDGGDAGQGFEDRRLMPWNEGLVVALGSSAALDDAMAAVLGTAAPVEDPFADDQDLFAEEPAEDTGSDFGFDETDSGEIAAVEVPSGASVMVHGLHYDAQSEVHRVVVLSDAPADYQVFTPDAETVVVSLPGARIVPEAAGRITTRPGAPVSLITAYQQPDVPGDEVRVVMTRAAGLAPSVSRRGSMLFVDFPNTGAAAPAPPVLTMDESGPPPDLATAELGAPLEGSLDTGLDGGELSSGPAGELAPLEASPVAEADPIPAELEPAVALDVEPQAVPASLEPPASVDILQEGGLIDGKEYKGRRISLDFKEVEIADVLRLVAEVSNLNIIAGDEVTGAVTIRLVDVPWDQALDVILLTKGLGFIRVGNVLRIAPAEVIKQEEELRLQERRAKEKLEDLVVKLQPVNYADSAEVAKLVQRLLSPRGSVNIDKRTNTLIIKDIASVIDEATALVKAVDTQTPQVLIEAKVVEANLDFSRELGSNWNLVTNPLTDPFDPGSAPRTDLGGEDFLIAPNTVQGAAGGNGFEFLNPITSTATGVAGLGAFILDEQLNVNLLIQAAESKGEGKVVSSPRIVTLDNQEAEIEQGVSIPFQTFENGDAQLEFIDAVLSLKVKPQITNDKSIIMEIEVTRNAPDDSVQTPTGSPAIAKNQATTNTLVKNGQTLVIGGIYTVNKSERRSRVPYLHKIPVLGAAFQSKEVSDSRKELLIFVTPRVVLSPDEPA
ncbi:MAG: type IV pilus secretin PilQ [Proteobacteria bacterium]|nr:type IV pilus secretin PilQ [Pseudomonadota bacterium]